MTMLVLQWAGAILIVLGYNCVLRLPTVSSALTFTGCALTGVWAYLLEPIGSGVIALECFIGAIALRNIWVLKCTR